MGTPRIFLFVLLVLGLISCLAGREPVVSKDSKEDGVMTLNNPEQSIGLVDHLRKAPGLNIQGDGASARITVRGIGSMNSSTEPLFVLDGQALNGGLRQAVEMVPVAQIGSIRVLKNPADTAMYGVRGGNGVILIKTKQR